jgi:hypothetical protein
MVGNRCRDDNRKMRPNFLDGITERSFHSSLDEVPSMKRSMWGITLIATAAALWSCNGDPTEAVREGEKIIADPSSVFLDEGATQFVTVELVDGQGNQLATDFAAQNVGAGITVAEDPTFLQTTIGTRLPTQERFVVTGLTPSVSSFDVVAGDTTLTIPVRVLPTFFAATFSNAAPAQNEIVTITAPAGFSFADVSGVVVGADTGVVVGHAVDGSTVSFVARPGLDTLPVISTVTVIGATSGLYPSVPLTLPSVDVMTVAPAAPVAGTAGTGTAPAIPFPATGTTSAFFDLPDFAATPDHFYRFDVAEAGDYTITVDWSVGSDVDVFLCINDAACAAPNFNAATANKPESATFTLPVGTTYIGVEDFGPLDNPPGTTANGGIIKITITHL